jgi:2'-5' RNA ligase
MAVDVDEATRDAVDELSRAVRLDSRLQHAGRASWVSKDRMHLTLYFAADADAPAERRVLDALIDPIPQPPFHLSFQGLGVFPERGAPRVLWLGIAEGLDQLRAVHREISRRLDPRKRRPEPFHPHLTLARFRERVPRDRLAEITAFPAAAGPSPIDRVTLYESRLSPKGPTYTAIAEAPLQITP